MKFQKALIPIKSKLIFNFIILSLLTIFRTPSSVNAQSPRSLLQTGLEFQDSPLFNVGSITTLFVTETFTFDAGSCVGQVYFPRIERSTRTYMDEESARARFISITTPPAPGLRVVIRNITQGIDQNSIPYTDREYDKPPLSQEFKLRLGKSHSSRYLAVQEGKNNFSYEIKSKDSVIESGTFTASINHQNKNLDREANNAYPFAPDSFFCQPPDANTPPNIPKLPEPPPLPPNLPRG
jgi:hypothetical protein